MLQVTNWLNNVVNKLLALSIFFPMLTADAQNRKSFTLQEVYQLSEQNYPAIRQKELIKQTEDITLRNLTTGFLPQISFSAQATYQSDVTRVDIPIPNIKVPAQSKDQYKVIADVSQLLYDGGTIKAQKNIQQLHTAVEERRVEIELYALKNRINQIYFGILYQDQLLIQNQLLQKDIQTGIDKVQQQVNNGVVLRSNLHVLQVQLLQAQQRAIDLRNTKKGLTDALSLFINTPVHETDQLEIITTELAIDTSISRPELKLYEDQATLLAGQHKLINARNQPKASAFAQGGYGRPALNMLSNTAEAFYIAGVRLNWSLGSLYNAKRERSLVGISKQAINVQKETFLLNTKSQLKQQLAEINRFQELVTSDQAIIELRSKVTAAAKSQLENAVITSNDYLREINAEDAARQALATHRLQLLQAQLNYQLTNGKL